VNVIYCLNSLSVKGLKMNNISRLGDNNKTRTKNMGDCSPDILDTEEEGGRNEEYEEEWEKEEDL